MRTTVPSGTPDTRYPHIDDLTDDPARHRLTAAIRQWQETKELHEAAKACLADIMGAYELPVIQCDDLRAHWRRETRKTTACAALLDAGVAPETIAACSSTASRAKLLRCGVDPVTIDQATSEKAFVKCYVERLYPD